MACIWKVSQGGRVIIPAGTSDSGALSFSLPLSFPSTSYCSLAHAVTTSPSEINISLHVGINITLRYKATGTHTDMKIAWCAFGG